MKSPDEIYLIPDNRMDNGLSIFWYEAQYSTGAIEYTRTDAFIQKACEWLRDNTMAELCLDLGNSQLVREFVDNFKEAMEA